VALHGDLPSRCFGHCETPAGRRSCATAQLLDERGGGA
jgi:hypothetical protein